MFCCAALGGCLTYSLLAECLSSVACRFVVQLSSILYHRAPFVGFTIVVLSQAGDVW